MLFVLDTDISEAAERHDNDAIRIINDLCRSVRYGRHSLYAARDVLQSIKGNAFLDLDTRHIASHILDNYSIRYGDVINHITQFVVLSSSQKSILVNRTHKGVYECVLPISYIDDDTFFRESILLLENSEEKEFYFQLADYYAIKNSLSRHFKFESDLGGGTTSSIVFSDHIHGKRICLCICDSDMKYPGDGYGETYDKIEAVLDPDWPLCQVVSTFPFREIENLIPIESLKRMSSKNGDIRNYCNDYVSLSAKSWNIQFYLDVKKGVTIEKLLRMGPTEKAYIESQLTKSGLITSAEITRINGLTKDEYSKEKNTALIHCCGNMVLSLYLKNNNSLIPAECSDSQKIINYHLGALVYNWGFCYGHIVI